MGNLHLFSLEGKRAIVTGAGQGLGAGMAIGLAQAGARVALVGRRESTLAETARETNGRGVPVPADISDLDGLAEIVDRAEHSLYGPIDIVIHSAGLQHRAPAEEFDIDSWNEVMNINLTSPFFLSQEIAQRQLASGSRGSHIFIGSLTSLISVPNIVAYTAGKSGVYGVIRNLSTEWSSRGIRVNGIGPGYFQTEQTKELFGDPARSLKMLDRIPMGRFGSPQDLTGTAVFLASEASAYLTGQLLMVDGGWSAN
jgi:2-deoxy-D-gluconate 3-dehydrogenase